MHASDWSSRSFTAPFTASGLSALVPPPPWHYAGWLLNVAFAHDPAGASGWVPPHAGRPTGAGCVHFADWQACTDGEALLDPVVSQYRETIVVLEVERRDGSRAMYCPFIWVDQDIALVRGLLQGWPKKMGRTWLTRSLPLQHPAASPLRAGSRLGASLTSRERRLVEAHAELTGRPGTPLGFLSAPTLGAVGWPDLTRPAVLPEPRLVRSDVRDRTEAGWHDARASLALFEHPTEELARLGDIVVIGASAGHVGITVAGAVDG